VIDKLELVVCSHGGVNVDRRLHQPGFTPATRPSMSQSSYRSWWEHFASVETQAAFEWLPHLVEAVARHERNSPIKEEIRQRGSEPDVKRVLGLDHRFASPQPAERPACR
jgi:hypothetical protein